MKLISILEARLADVPALLSLERKFDRDERQPALTESSDQAVPASIECQVQHRTDAEMASLQKCAGCDCGAQFGAVRVFSCVGYDKPRYLPAKAVWFYRHYLCATRISGPQNQLTHGERHLRLVFKARNQTRLFKRALRQ